MQSLLNVLESIQYPHICHGLFLTLFYLKEDVNSLVALNYENGLSKQGRETAERGIAEWKEAKAVNKWFTIGPCSQITSLNGNKLTFDCSPALTKGKLEPSDI